MKYYNPNPQGLRVGDCSVRAISKALNTSWEDAYIKLCVYGLMLSDMPSANSVWGRLLRDNGFVKKMIPEVYPDFYTVNKFCNEHKKGTYVLALSGHVVTVCNGEAWDSWDCGENVIAYYFEKGK